MRSRLKEIQRDRHSKITNMDRTDRQIDIQRFQRYKIKDINRIDKQTNRYKETNRCDDWWKPLGKLMIANYRRCFVHMRHWMADDRLWYWTPKHWFVKIHSTRHKCVERLPCRQKHWVLLVDLVESSHIYCLHNPSWHNWLCTICAIEATQ